MDDINELLNLTRDVARSACKTLCNSREEKSKSHSYFESLPREMKAVIDTVLEEEILARLVPTGLPILSEERGEIKSDNPSGLRFVVDPLDGTVNYIRGLGAASISIALYQHDKPVFGVLGIYPTGQLAWGGKGMGAFVDNHPIKVSAISDPIKAVICSGFPSRFQFADIENSTHFIRTLTRYGKVRMVGAASISLLQVARGAAELYFENEIMLWDVAAGLALVEGAGGVLDVKEGQTPGALKVVASNGAITFE